MDRQWIDTFWEKVEAKLFVVAPQVDTRIPYTTDKNGKYVPYLNGERQPDSQWWTNGFWGGLLWLAWKGSKKDCYKELAIACEDALDQSFLDFYGLNHDVGFMWFPTAVTHYLIDGNEKSKNRGLHAATLLAGRFNCQCDFLRAWNSKERAIGWSIIDSMMNLPILYWATEETADPRFRMIAERHANTVAKHFVRPDGSVNHIVSFDPNTGEVLDTPAGQGYASGSSWTRGQAWAIYGFALSYIYTGKQEYLEVAKRVAHYFIANLSEDGVPVVDFRAPKEPVLKDTSAGAIAACGMIEIMKHVNEHEKDLYENAAEKLLKGLEKHCDFTLEKQSILQDGTVDYHNARGHHVSLIYGDYYLMEALLKLKQLREEEEA